jgi:hypothetical protein
LALNLLQEEPSKQSLKMKRYLAGMSDNFPIKILESAEVELNNKPQSIAADTEINCLQVPCSISKIIFACHEIFR